MVVWIEEVMGSMPTLSVKRLWTGPINIAKFSLKGILNSAAWAEYSYSDNWGGKFFM